MRGRQISLGRALLWGAAPAFVLYLLGRGSKPGIVDYLANLLVLVGFHLLCFRAIARSFSGIPVDRFNPPPPPCGPLTASGMPLAPRTLRVALARGRRGVHYGGPRRKLRHHARPFGSTGMADRVVLLSIPQLRRRDVTPGCLASLDALAARGAISELVPPFPGLAAASFATLTTGTGPYEHGLVGNSYFDRRGRRVVLGPLPDSEVMAPRIWDRLRAARPESRSLVWFGPNTGGASVALSAGLEPPWRLATNPPELADRLVAKFGPFPCPEANRAEPPRLECTSWMLKTAADVIASEAPELAIVRVPYLGQVARRFGPDGREAGRAILALESALAPFLKSLARDTLVLAATESVSTPVSGPIYPNRVLRALGLLALGPADGGGLDIDLQRSAAFALADHQVAHIYLNDPGQAATVASAFAGLHGDGVATVAPGPRRASLGLDHPRSGDVVLVSDPDRWFAPDWWSSADERPRGPAASGLAATGASGPVESEHVRGSLGAPAPNASYLGVVVASARDVLGNAPQVATRDLAAIALTTLGVKEAEFATHS